MKKVCCALMLALAMTGSAAAEVYRCVERGRTSISTEPCPSGAKSEAVAVEKIDPEAVKAAAENLARQKAELDRLQQARLQREAIEAEQRRAAALEEALRTPPQPEPVEVTTRSYVYPPYRHPFWRPGMGRRFDPPGPPRVGPNARPPYRPGRPPAGGNRHSGRNSGELRFGP